jgi:hypothetical protein
VALGIWVANIIVFVWMIVAYLRMRQASRPARWGGALRRLFTRTRSPGKDIEVPEEKEEKELSRRAEGCVSLPSSTGTSVRPTCGCSVWPWERAT